MSEMVERVEVAIEVFLMDHGLPRATREIRSRMARTILQAMREPTEAMLGVGQLGGDISEGQAEWCWQAMIDEALK